LPAVEFDALLALGRHGQLKQARLKPLVPDAKTVAVPVQDFDPVAGAVKEDEQA